MASLYQKRLAQRRKTADITRLADQYKKNVEAMTGEQDKAFAAYQAKAKQDMAPYEASIAQYNTAFSQYQQQAAAYNQRLTDYQKMLSEFEANPYERVAAQVVSIGRGGSLGARVYDQNLSVAELEEGGFEPEVIYGPANRGGRPVIGIKSIKVPKAAPASFNEKAPTAPTAPTPPKIAEFDTSEFEAKRGQLETEFKRELGERKGARLAAVSRKTTRPLMQGQG